MSKIVNLKTFELVFTTSFFYKHGVSGHLYEMIDYFLVCSASNIKCAILLADGTTLAEFNSALQKYSLTDDELTLLEQSVFECARPKIIQARNVCIVDGSWRVLDCTIYADNAFLLRCSEPDFSFFHNHKTIKRSHIMQDCRLYDERYEDINVEVVDYVKKILWSKYKQPTPTNEDVGLLYLTTACRSIDVESVEKIISKRLCSKYLIVTNDPQRYASLASETVAVEAAPVANIFDRFTTYIYTPTEYQSDCSPRFIVECAVYGKKVVYEIDYTCRGIDRRREDITTNLQQLELTLDDFFIDYVKRHMNETV